MTEEKNDEPKNFGFSVNMSPDFINWLKRTMMKFGISQSQLANELGMANTKQGWLSQVLNRVTKKVGASKIKALEDGLKSIIKDYRGPERTEEIMTEIELWFGNPSKRNIINPKSLSELFSVMEEISDILEMRCQLHEDRIRILKMMIVALEEDPSQKEETKTK